MTGNVYTFLIAKPLRSEITDSNYDCTWDLETQHKT